MLPCTPTSPPDPSLSPSTYGTTGSSTKVLCGHDASGVLEVKTCLVVRLMKSAKGWTSEVGQYPGPVVVGAVPEEDVVLRADHVGEVGEQLVIRIEEPVARLLGNAVEREQGVEDDVAHASS